MQATLTTSTLLDRQAARRGDTAWLAALKARPETRFLLIVDGRVLIASNAERTEAGIRWLTRSELLALPLPGHLLASPIFLGTCAGGAGQDAAPNMVGSQPAGRFAIALGRIGQLGGPAIASADAQGGLARALPGPLVDLRSLAMQGVMPADQLSLVGLALMLSNWHATHGFCPRCGTATAAADGGWKRTCGNGACAADGFPRIDPVVIMLVVAPGGGRALLTREARFPEGMWSTLAGFVEPGEDIAHAVTREVREEVGLETSAVGFVASQPWPFPHSLMIGCIAEATSTALAPDPSEITAARWVGRDEMRAIRDGRHGEGIRLPGRQSLANVLVETWLEDDEFAQGGG